MPQSWLRVGGSTDGGSGPPACSGPRVAPASPPSRCRAPLQAPQLSSWPQLCFQFGAPESPGCPPAGPSQPATWPCPPSAVDAPSEAPGTALLGAAQARPSGGAWCLHGPGDPGSSVASVAAPRPCALPAGRSGRPASSDPSLATAASCLPLLMSQRPGATGACPRCPVRSHIPCVSTLAPCFN